MTVTRVPHHPDITNLQLRTPLVSRRVADRGGIREDVALLRLTVAFLVFLGVTAALQWHGGAYMSDFAGSPDEAAHYVTGLMVHDYLVEFPWPSPLPFAQNFYDHYPKVAIGHWPPIFYLSQAIWALPFGSSRFSMLVLLAVISALTASILFCAWRPRFGTAIAAALAVAFLATPVVQEYSRMVMAEMPVALLVVVSTMAYARYLQTERWSDSAAFGVLASAAILTKANGMALAFLPLLAVIATRRMALMKRLSFWLAALIVVALCGPWYALTADLAREGWTASYSPSWLLREPASQNARALIGVAGAPVFFLALIGMFYEIWRPWRHRAVNGFWAVMAGLLISTWIFHTFVLPVREARHLIPAIPALLAFSAAGVAGVASVFRDARPAVRLSVVMALVGIAATPLALAALRVPHKPLMGSEAVVEELLSHREFSDAVLLVASESYGEGVFIAELAGRERRPGHRVLRASKVLSSANWDGSNYQLSQNSVEETKRYLEDAHVGLIVLDRGSGGSELSVPHFQQLLDVIHSDPERWRLVAWPRAAESRFQVFQAFTSR